MGNGVIEITGKIGREYTRSGYSRFTEKNDGQVYDDKLRAAGNLDEAVRASTDYVNEEIKHPRKDNIKEFARGRVLMRVGQNDYNAEVVVGYTQNGEMLLYDIVNFKPDSFSVKERTPRRTGPDKAGMTETNEESSSDNSISQNIAAVNSQYTQESENDASDTAEVGADTAENGADTAENGADEGDFAVDRKGSEASAAFSDEALDREGYTPTEQTRVIAMNEATRTGREYGASPAQQAAAEELSHILDRRIVFFRSDDPTVNGYYKNGTIHVNAASGRTVASIIASEMTHAIETTSDYGALRELALRELSREKGMSLDELRAQKKETYAAHGENLDADGVDFELCEEYVGRYLFGDVAQIRAAVDYKPSLGRKIIAFLDEIIRRLTGRVRAVSSRILKDAQYARELWGRAVREVKARGAESAETKFSFAGEKSATADTSLLQKAMQLDEEGRSSEDIRRETGWFKGYDGQWRYEIDDLDAHLIENPKLERHTDGEEVYFTGKLSDILDHGELFTAYPELRNINVIIQSTEPGVEGIYQRNSNYITLSTELFKRHTKEYTDYLEGGRKAEIERIEQTPEYREYNKFFEDDAYGDTDAAEWLKLEKEAMNKFFSSDLGKRYHELVWGNDGFTGRKFELGWSKNAKAVLMHELQHAIQGIEGFAGGSSVESWSARILNEAIGRKDDLRNELREESRSNPEIMDAVSGYDEYIDRMLRDGYVSDTEFAKAYDRFADEITGEKAQELFWAYAEATEKYYRSKNDIQRLSSSKYVNTAGEVEARDVSGRSEYTAEQRKNTRPDIDRSDVVFANDGVSYSAKKGYSDYEKPITPSNVKTAQSIVRKSINAFTSEDIQKTQKWAHKFYRELGTKSPFFRAWFGDWRAHDTGEVKVADVPEYVATNEARKANRGIVRNNDTGWGIRISRDGESNTISHAGEDKLSEYGLAGIRGLTENGVLLDSEVHEHHTNNAKNDMIAFDHKLYAVGRDTSGNVALYKITVEEAYHDHKHTNERRFHNLKYIEKVATVGGRTAGQSLPGVSTNDDIATTYTVADILSLVKAYDEDFTPAHDVSPELLNEDGTPKVFYHGTMYDFTEFRSEEISPAEGSYFFAENREDAEGYGSERYGGHVMEVYLSAENLADYNDQPSEFYQLKDKREQVQWLKDRGYDGWYADMDSGGWGEVSVFSPNQIKSATDNIGTFDRGNNDIRYSLEDSASGWDAYHRRNQEELESNTSAAERARRTERAEERAAAEEEARDRLDTLANGGTAEDRLFDSAKSERGNIERENMKAREATMTQEEYERIIGKPLTEEEAADLREEISKAAGSIAAEEDLYSAAEEERLFLEEERTTVAPKWFEQVKKSGEKKAGTAY